MQESAHRLPSPSRLPRHVYTHIRGGVGEPQHLAELPDPGPGVWPNRQSSGVAFRRAVLEIGSGERQRLPNVVRLKLGIIPEKVVPVRVQCHGLHDSTHRQPHATDTRLTVHLVRVPRDAIKALHHSYSISIPSGTFPLEVNAHSPGPNPPSAGHPLFLRVSHTTPGPWPPAPTRYFAAFLHGSVREAPGSRHPYRDPILTAGRQAKPHAWG